MAKSQGEQPEPDVTYLPVLISPVLSGWDLLLLLLLLLHQWCIGCWVLNSVCEGGWGGPGHHLSVRIACSRATAEPDYYAVNQECSVWSCGTHVLGSECQEQGSAHPKWGLLGSNHGVGCFCLWAVAFSRPCSDPLPFRKGT